MWKLKNYECKRKHRGNEWNEFMWRVFLNKSQNAKSMKKRTSYEKTEKTKEIFKNGKYIYHIYKLKMITKQDKKTHKPVKYNK